jgi:PKD repeat protein
MGLMLSFFGLSQLQSLNHDLQLPSRSAVSSNRTTSCGPDTVQYALAKATGLQALNINNSTSAQAACQYFDTPQAITISGADFYAYKIDATGGPIITITVELYMAGVDSMPMGTPLATVPVVIDTTFGGGNLAVLKKSATFTTPVTVTQPYVISISNISPNGIGLLFNDYNAVPADGSQEWLCSVDLFGTWTRSYNVNVGGVTFDADLIVEPHVSYDLTADFSHDAGCLVSSETVNFTNASSPILNNRMYSQAAFVGLTDLSYTYDFGDGSALVNSENTTHTYNAGSYMAVLTDTLFGWTTNCTDQHIVQLGGASQNAAFTSSVNNQTVNFTDASLADSTILSWIWDFGDGNTSTMQNPNHTYAVSGNYTVCLTITTSCGSDSSCMTVNVVGCPDPVAVFSNTINNLIVSFTDNSTTDNAISSWLWDFGDGNTSTMQNPTHTYIADGSYTVCLTVTDACGTDSTCTNITVSAGGACPDPVASFSSMDNFLTVNYTDNSTTDNTITSWLWDFGDGNTSTMQNPVHSYTNSGAYTVCLTVSDSCGSDSTCMTVNVTDSTVALSEYDLNLVRIYPNPVSTVLNIHNPSKNNINILLLDATGKLIETEQTNEVNFLLNAEHLAEGIYFIQFNTETSQKTLRFIKQ